MQAVVPAYEPAEFYLDHALNVLRSGLSLMKTGFRVEESSAIGVSMPGRRPERRAARNAKASRQQQYMTAEAAASDSSGRSNHVLFPKQLLEILSNDKFRNVIGWLHHGHAFAIKDTDTFASDIMPKFTRGKLTSFQRQLNLYGFRKVTKGDDCKAGKLVYFHPSFKRGRPELMVHIKRLACKGEMSLNKLRNNDLPYDPNVRSEDMADAPQADDRVSGKKRKRVLGPAAAADAPLVPKDSLSDLNNFFSVGTTESSANLLRLDIERAEQTRKAIKTMENPPLPQAVLPMRLNISVPQDAQRRSRPLTPPASSTSLASVDASSMLAANASAVQKFANFYSNISMPTGAVGDAGAGDATEAPAVNGADAARTPPSFVGISSETSPNVQDALQGMLPLSLEQPLPSRLNIPLPKEFIIKNEQRQAQYLKEAASGGKASLPRKLNLPAPARLNVDDYLQAPAPAPAPAPVQQLIQQQQQQQQQQLLQQQQTTKQPHQDSFASDIFTYRETHTVGALPPLSRRLGFGSGLLRQPEMRRNISNVSVLSLSSDLWGGQEDLESDIDFTGLFEDH
jgi:hypothetical protein